jgi:integrase
MVDKERRTFGSLKQFGEIWWIRYRVDGKERWESLKTTSLKVAEKKAAVLEDRVGRGEHQPADARKLSFTKLAELVRADYKAKGNRSTRRLEKALDHLSETFGTSRALAITSERVDDYDTSRTDAGAARATINYELAILRRAFRLAVKKRMLPSAPSITIHAARNARSGYFERDDFAAVIAELSEALRPVMTFAYLTGWRVQSEVMPLTWSQVDFEHGTIRLEVGTTKNDEARIFPFALLPELSALLEERRELTRAMERATGRIIPFVFHHRDGQPLKSYKNGWHAACGRAARGGSSETIAEIIRPQLVGRIVHDFRRTAVRNLVRAGVSEGVAMKLTGHKTRSIFDRYNITSETDLREGVAKLANHLSAPTREAEQTKEGTQRGPLSSSPLSIAR